jgi:hypothetical protein
MERDDQLIADWTALHTTAEGEAPPHPLVARCAAVFGPNPDVVLCQAIHDHGTRWKVAVLTASLFGCAEARSAHPHWDSQAYVHQLGHDDGATYDCWAVSVREVTSVGTLPHEDDGQHWRPVAQEDGGGLLTSWRVYQRDGHHTDLPFGELPVDLESHERAEAIAVTLLKLLAV